MIEKICARLEAEMNEVVAYDEDDYYLGKYAAYGSAISIVREVAKEYGNGWIPVESELPKKEGIYLCTVFHADIYIVWIMRFKNGQFQRPDDVEGLDYEVLAWKQIAPYQKSPSRCDTCTHNVADEVPPICYMCSKGIEDNYQKGE